LKNPFCYCCCPVLSRLSPHVGAPWFSTTVGRTSLFVIDPPFTLFSRKRSFLYCWWSQTSKSIAIDFLSPLVNCLFLLSPPRGLSFDLAFDGNLVSSDFRIAGHPFLNECCVSGVFSGFFLGFVILGDLLSFPSCARRGRGRLAPLGFLTPDTSDTGPMAKTFA